MGWMGIATRYWNDALGEAPLSAKNALASVLLYSAALIAFITESGSVIPGVVEGETKVSKVFKNNRM